MINQVYHMHIKCFVSCDKCLMSSSVWLPNDWGGWGEHECTKFTEVQIKTQIFSLVVMNGVTGGEIGHRLGEIGDTVDACQDSCRPLSFGGCLRSTAGE